LETKYVVFLVGLMGVVPIAVLCVMISRRLHEAVFFAIVFGTVLKGEMDVNFVSREFYRGSSRGFEFSFVDLLGIVLLVSTLLKLSKNHGRRLWPPSFTLMSVYFFWCCLSVASADPKLFGCFELVKLIKAMTLFLAVFLFVQGKREIAILTLALCACVLYAFLVAVVQRYAYGGWRVPGPFGHPCEFSMYVNLVAPVLIAAAVSELPKAIRWICAFCAGMAGLCVIFTISRTGFATYVLILFATLILLFPRRLSPKHLVIGVAITIVSVGVLARAWDTLANRLFAVTLSEEFLDSEYDGRGRYFRMITQIVPDFPLWGMGLNNWSYITTRDYPVAFRARPEPYNGTSAIPPSLSNQEVPAHNILVLTLGELGIPGLLMFCAVWARWIQMGAHFLHRRSADLYSRFGTGVLFAFGAIFLESMTSPSSRNIPAFYLTYILSGTLASVYCLSTKESRNSCVRTQKIEPFVHMHLPLSP